jgi:ABC-type nitrate/sulfonate/bicarbonate transport system substrate-binding protein
MKVGVVPTPLSWLSEFALYQGFFKKNGLDVSLVQINTGAQDIAGTKNGAWQLAAGTDVILASPAYEKGIKMMAVAGQLRSPFVIVGSGSNGTEGGYPDNMKAIAGNTIAVTGLGSEQQYTVEAIDSLAGLPLDAMKFQAAGSVAGIVASLEAGHVKYGVVDATGLAILQSSGKPFHIIMDLRQSIPASAGGNTPAGRQANQIAGKPQSGVWGLTSWVTEHKEQVNRFRLSVEEADCWVHDPANFDAALSILKNKMKEVPPNLSSAQEHSYLSDNLPISYYPQETMQAWMDIVVKVGLVKEPIPMSQILAPGTPQSEQDVYKDVTTAGGSCNAYAPGATTSPAPS